MPEPRWYQRLLELVALCGFAVAQPLLATFGTSPETFIFQDASRADIVVFALAIAVVPPVLLWLVEAVAGLAGARVVRVVHLSFVGALVGLVVVQALKQLGSLRGVVVVLVAVAVGLGAVAVYRRVDAARLFLRISAAAPALFVAMFLFSSSVAPLVTETATSTASGSAGGSPSTVLVVFDEWPTASIIDTDGRIDRSRAPNLAAFADSATWYRNASSVSNSTRYAVPAILTGRLQRSDQLPVASSQPKNLFSLFAPTHRLSAFESVTGLCPGTQCATGAPTDGDGLAGVIDDAARTFLRRISPSDTRVDVTTQFVEETSPVRTRDFAALASRQKVLARAITNRPARFDAFLRSFHRNERPTLHVVHLLLPHVPLRFLPSGTEYPAPVPEIGRQGDVWTDDPYAIALAHQRALIQTMYLDRLIGELTARLRATGLLDRSAVALTADHGIAYDPGLPSRALNDDALPRSLYPQLLWAPLVVKAPGQTGGAVSDADVMSIDVLPTLASLAHVPLRWHVDGKVAGTRRGTTRMFQRAHSDAVGGRLDPTERFDGTDALADVRAHGVDTVTFDGDATWAPWRLRPWGASVGTPLADLAVGEGSAVTASLEQRDALRHVDPASGSVPALLWGTADRDAEIAVALNGVVAGVSPTFTSVTARRFAVLAPETLLRRGANRVQLFEIERRPGGDVLHPMSMR